MRRTEPSGPAVRSQGVTARTGSVRGQFLLLTTRRSDGPGRWTSARMAQPRSVRMVPPSTLRLALILAIPAVDSKIRSTPVASPQILAPGFC